MPNHETNTVVIVGEPAKIRAFVAEGLADGVDDQPAKVIDFTLIIPEPEGIDRGGCSGQHAEGVVCWYEWNINAWGTKWGAYSHSHYDLRFFKNYQDEVYGRIDLRFETAWSQPTPILAAIEERWGVKVHAVTLDEGGYPDVEYGDPYDTEFIRRAVSHEFEAWHTALAESEVPA